MLNVREIKAFLYDDDFFFEKKVNDLFVHTIYALWCFFKIYFFSLKIKNEKLSINLR